MAIEVVTDQRGIIQLSDEQVFQVIGCASASQHSTRGSNSMEATRHEPQTDIQQSTNSRTEPECSRPASATPARETWRKAGATQGGETEGLYANYLKISTELKENILRKRTNCYDDESEISVEELKKKKLKLDVEVKELEKEKLQLEMRNMLDVVELHKQKLHLEIKLLEQNYAK